MGETRRRRRADSEAGVTAVKFNEIISYTGGSLVAVVAIGRVLLGYALRD